MEQEIEKIKELESSYDNIPYKSKVFYNTQPNKMKGVFKLLNFDTPDLETARVLEIGCSFGGNILPFALANPNAEVIGVDLSKTQVDEGNRIIQHIGLTNIKLIHQNILEFSEDMGEFDYIICHGVYSWVPDIVKEGIIKVIKKHLSKTGVAVVSYNTYPGWKSMEISKEAMLFREKFLKDSGYEIEGFQRAAVGKGILEFLKDHSHLNERIRNSMKTILEKDDYYILHEYFEEYNDPCYLYDFNKKLLENDLIHVTDSELTKSFPTLSEEVAEKIKVEAGENHIVREQYYDYIFDVQFRTSFITHVENLGKINLSGNINVSDIQKLHYRAFFPKNEEGKYKLSNGSVVVDPKEEFLIDQITRSYPNTITAEEIFDIANDDISVTEIASMLIKLVYSKEIEFYTKEEKVEYHEKLKVSDKYRRYLEYFAAAEYPAITISQYQGYGSFDLDPFQIKLILEFDGVKTDLEIVNLFLEKEKVGELNVNPRENETKEDAVIRTLMTYRKIVEENFWYR